MSGKSREKDDRGPPDSDEDFQYEEVSLEDDWSSAEGEEDLEATVKAIRERAEAGAAAPGPDASAVDDFLRSFLLHAGMTRTLDCFQTEWAEVAQKGLVDPRRVGAVPGVYAENQRLLGELRNARREADEYRRAAAAAAETLARVRRARDLRRLQHQRVVQERDRLVEEMRRLKVRCGGYEPAVKRMNEKYQAVLKQTALAASEGDRAAGQPARRCGAAGEEGAVNRTGKPSVEGTGPPGIQPRPPTSANTPRSQSRVQSVKANVC